MAEEQEDTVLYLSSKYSQASTISTQLSRPLVLTDAFNYELGLLRLFYPGQFYNVTHGDMSYYSFTKKTRTMASVPTQFYATPQQFIEAFTTAFGQDSEFYPLSYDEHSRKFQILLRSDGVMAPFLQISPNLARFMRLPEQIDQKLGYVESITPWDPTAGQEQMFLHCNLVNFVNVNTTCQPLLTALGHGAGRKTTTGQIVYEPSNVLYIPISQKVISEISIDFKTADGKGFPFIGGETMAVLHLRPSQPFI